MTAADLHTQIAARTAHAIREALDQLANGWTDTEVLKVAVDAWGVIQELKDQADAVEELDGMRDFLWRTACKQPSPYHEASRCYLSGGHPGHHLYTVTAGWVAA